MGTDARHTDPARTDPASTGTTSAGAGPRGTARPGRHTSPIRGVRRPAAAAALVAGLILAGVGVAGFATASRTGHPATHIAPISPGAFAPIPKGKWAAVPPAVSQSVAEPVSLVIPAINVSTRLIHLGVTRTGALQVPASTAVAGWYTGSPRPGAVGAAVIAGHVDSRTALGVFYWLRILRPGDRVYVKRADGTLAVFRVTSVRAYAKDQFPTAAVYGPVPDAELRLITCGGTFDWSTGHYLSNVVVFARLTD